MKNKFISFLLAMGIPFSAIFSRGTGCNGICGSCSFTCTPGIFVLLLLVCKYFYGKGKSKVIRHE